MRILLSCLQSLKAHELPAYAFWRTYFMEGCAEAGIECLETPDVDWAEALLYPQGDERLAAWRDRTWQRTIDYARQELFRGSIAFSLSYFYPVHVEPAGVAELQKLGIPCVNFFCDNVRQFRWAPSCYRPFDLHWTPEFEALAMYRAASLPVIHLPMPCWVPTELRRIPMAETESPCFIGSADAMRADILGRAIKAGADIAVFGRGWAGPSDAAPPPQASRGVNMLTNQIAVVRKDGLSGLAYKIANRCWPPEAPPAIPADRIGAPVSVDEYVRRTREARVTIGVNRVPTARALDRRPIVYSRLRDLEAPMLGACYLTEWTAGIEHLFDLGNEVETYRTPEELCEKLAALEDDSGRRQRMRQAAQRRALADHSISRSMKLIAERLGVGTKS